MSVQVIGIPVAILADEMMGSLVFGSELRFIFMLGFAILGAAIGGRVGYKITRSKDK